MNIGRPATTTEEQTLIFVAQYYIDMLPRGSHILALLTEAASDPKGRKYFGMTHYKLLLKN